MGFNYFGRAGRQQLHVGFPMFIVWPIDSGLLWLRRNRRHKLSPDQPWPNMGRLYLGVVTGVIVASAFSNWVSLVLQYRLLSLVSSCQFGDE